MITTVPLDAATTGMQLAKDLSNEAGSILLPQGCVLTPAIVNALRERGIASVAVIVNQPDNAATLPNTSEPSILTCEAEPARRLAHIFRHGGGEANQQLQSALRCLRLPEVA